MIEYLMTPDDQPMKLEVGCVNFTNREGLVFVKFAKALSWFALTVEEARALANLFLEKAAIVEAKEKKRNGDEKETESSGS